MEPRFDEVDSTHGASLDGAGAMLANLLVPKWVKRSGVRAL